MSVVEVVDVVAVPDLGVTAPRSVFVGVFLRARAGHRRPPRGRIVASPRGSVKDRAPLVRAGLVALLLLAASGCAPAPPTGRPVAAATIAPLSDLVARVAGPDWEVRTVVPPGISAHVFEPEPSDVRRLASARIVVVVGAGYDGWIRRMAEACASTAPVHDTASSLGIGAGEPAEEHEHDHGEGRDHGHGEEDPHWWLSPALASRAVGPLAEALAGVDPSGREGYRERARELQRELAALDEEIAARLLPVKGRSFVAAHAAWSHFAGRYGLTERGAIEPVPGREPSARELRALVDGARQAGDGVLFTEPQFPAGAARAVASDAGLGLVLVDPIGGVPTRATYAETMRFNAAAFARGLSARAGRPEA